MKQKSRKGFTMVEMIVIVGLLAIIGAIGTNHFMGVFEANRIAAQRAEAERLAGALNAFNAVARGPGAYPGDSRVVTVFGETPNFFPGHWGAPDANGNIANVRGLMSSCAGQEPRRILHDDVVSCVFSQDPCDEEHHIQLRHYVNRWIIGEVTPGASGGFASTGVMQADFSLTMDCATIVALLNPSDLTEPHISFINGRWVVLP